MTAVRIIAANTAIALLVASAGLAYEAIGTWRDRHRFVRRGRQVRVGHLTFNIACEGEGTPTVILESGLTLPALEWIEVQPQLANITRVCSYDRAGYGWSDPGPEPRTTAQISKELKALLEEVGEKGPFILVGHSFGGFIVRVFTHRYPADVAGVVLVDASHEDEDDRINALLPEGIREQEKKTDEWNATVNRIMNPLGLSLGIQRFKVEMGWAGSPHLSKQLRQELFYLRQQPKSRHAIASEGAAWTPSIAEVRASGNLGGRPLIVLTADKPYDRDPLLSNEQMERQNDLWIHDLQAQEARLSTRGKQIIVPDSDHMIPYERPDAVVSAVKEVWSDLRPK